MSSTTVYDKPCDIQSELFCFFAYERHSKVISFLRVEIEKSLLFENLTLNDSL